MLNFIVSLVTFGAVKLRACPQCNGKGREPVFNAKCMKCNGSGRIKA